MAHAPVSPNTPALSAVEQAWLTIRDQLRAEFGERTFLSWLEPLQLAGFDEGEITLALPTHFTCEWVRNNFLERLRGLWTAAIPQVRGVRLIVRAARPTTSPVRIAQAQSETPVLSDQSGLETRLRFDGFIVGKSNEVAYGAARALAEGGQVNFNPLFLHGGTGLGKTHLMHAIGWETLKRRPDARVAYMSAERFMVEFLAAIRAKETIAFKQRLRALDLLLLDDVQFIAGKESTQEEFFHTLNELISSGRKVVISADRGPQDLAGLQDRILSRLAGGMVADVDQADYELRLNVLHAKLGQLHDVACPNDVLEFLARKITSNVRELEGALTRVAAYATLTARAITIETTRQVLADQLRAHDRRITIDEIQRKTADYYGLKLADLLSPRRAREVARPRQVAMYLAKKLTPRSLPEIGRRFGGRDHTTVMHGVKRIEGLRVADTELNGDVAKLLRAFDA